MSPELQKYYEARFSMMTSQGWLDLIEDFKRMREATNTLLGVTKETLDFKQGEISIMDLVLNLKTASERAYEELQFEELQNGV